MSDKTEKANDENVEEKVSLDALMDNAIATLLKQIRTNLKPVDQLQQTQAVLNMAHAKSIFCNIEHNKQQSLKEEHTPPKKQGAGAS